MADCSTPVKWQQGIPGRSTIMADFAQFAVALDISCLILSVRTELCH